MRSFFLKVSAAALMTIALCGGLFYLLGKRLFPVKKPSSIGIYTGSDPFLWAPAAGIENPVITAADVTDLPADMVADPFMIKDGGQWWMFFEVVDAGSNKGSIALASSKDALSWQYEKVVLSEPFHMSYPYVFKWKDSYYMIPETHLANGVRLYKAERFPYEWRFERTLITGMFPDPSILEYNGKWWLFVTDVVGNDRLRIFFADTLDGNWTEHPMSPVVKNDPTKARPGGRMIIHEGKPVRFAQDDGRFYGRAVRAFIIDTLTTDDYLEHEADVTPILQGDPDTFTWWTWNAKGMHHIDPHQISHDRWIACVDGFYKYHYWSWDAFRELTIGSQ